MALETEVSVCVQIGASGVVVLDPATTFYRAYYKAAPVTKDLY